MHISFGHPNSPYRLGMGAGGRGGPPLHEDAIDFQLFRGPPSPLPSPILLPSWPKIPRMARNGLTFPLICPVLLLFTVVLFHFADSGVEHTGKHKKALGGAASLSHAGGAGASGVETRKRKKKAESDVKRRKKKQKLKQKRRLEMKKHHGEEPDSGLVSIFRKGILLYLSHYALRNANFRDHWPSCEALARSLRHRSGLCGESVNGQ
jgi:hypothetical protein